MARLQRAEELRRVARRARLDPVARRRRARHAGARRGDPVARSPSEPPRRGYRVPRISHYLGRWIRGTDWYPDYQLRLYDRRAGRWNGRRVHESVRARTESRAQLTHDLQHYPVSRHQRSPRHDRPLHDARRRADGARTAASPSIAGVALHPPFAFLRNYILRGGFSNGGAGFIVSVLNSYYVFLKLAKAWASRALRASRLPPRASIVMFSLHIDTARTWRGGQNQVLLTVLGLRALGHRSMLVAHRGRRAAPAREGRARSDPAGAEDGDGPERRVAAVAPDQAAQARRHPRARSARRGDGGAGAVDEHAARPSRRWSRRAASTSTCKGNALSRWKYRQVDCFVCASDAIRHDAGRRRRAGGARGHDPRRHRPRARRSGAAGQPARRAVAAAPRADRRQRRRAGAAQGAAPSDRGGGDRRQAGARRALRHRRRRGAARRRSSGRSRSTTSRSTSSSPASAPTSSRCTRRSTSS